MFRAGPLVDASLVVKPAPAGTKDLTLKSPGAVVSEVVILKHDSLGSGTLDPIVGAFASGGLELKFEYIATIAAWRQVDVVQVILFALVALPVGLVGAGFIIGSDGQPAGLFFGGALVALCAVQAVSTFRTRALRLRVVGLRDKTIDVKVVGKRKARQRLVDALLERTGLKPAVIP